MRHCYSYKPRDKNTYILFQNQMKSSDVKYEQHKCPYKKSKIAKKRSRWLNHYEWKCQIGSDVHYCVIVKLWSSSRNCLSGRHLQSQEEVCTGGGQRTQPGLYHRSWAGTQVSPNHIRIFNAIQQISYDDVIKKSFLHKHKFCRHLLSAIP